MTLSKRVLVVIAVTVLASSQSQACFKLCDLFKRKCRAGTHPIVAAPSAITSTAVELLQEIVHKPEQMMEVLGPSIMQPHTHSRHNRRRK
jgi:hypothetical protein